MRFRHWMSIVAALCVLLHAGLLVRHNNVVLTAAYQQALGLEVSVWCGIVPPASDWSSPFDTPGQQQQSSKCPICVGAAPAAALADAALPTVWKQPVAAVEAAFIAERHVPRAVAFLPPSHAPPFLA